MKKKEENITVDTNVIVNPELVVFNHPNSRMSEAIKTIRTNLQFSAVDKSIRTLMVTSSIAGEGKSFVTSNLACAFAGVSAKVLLVDCDLRRGRQHEIFGVNNTKGLSNLLIDDVNKYKEYVQKTNVKNVSILPSGILPPNPSELLGSNKNGVLIDILKKDYDIVIFDCPPVNGLPDAVVMTAFADSVILVCSTGKTPIELLEKAKKTLMNVNAKMAGVVVNRIDDGTTSRYYDSYYSQ